MSWEACSIQLGRTSSPMTASNCLSLKDELELINDWRVSVRRLWSCLAEFTRFITHRHHSLILTKRFDSNNGNIQSHTGDFRRRAAIHSLSIIRTRRLYFCHHSCCFYPNIHRKPSSIQLSMASRRFRSQSRF